MSEIITQLQNDLHELQLLLQKQDLVTRKLPEEDQKTLTEKSIYIENTYTLEDLQAEGLGSADIRNCLEAVGIVLGYSDLARADASEAINHFMMALHYNPYSKDGLCALLELFMENMEEEGRGAKVYDLLSQMYDFSQKEDRQMVLDCALETDFMQLFNEIIGRQIEN